MHQIEQQEKLPLYRSHKKVWAAKITDIKASANFPDSSVLYFDEIDDSIIVDRVWLQRNGPVKVGGYYTVYEDNYRCYFPGKQFEAGHTRIDQEPILEPLFKVEPKEYVSRNGYRCRVLFTGHHGQDCSVPMVCYMNLDPTFDNPPGKIWMVSESFFVSRFRELP